MSSLCASGTSLKVKTPQPSLKRRYAPKEMRAQKGSYDVVSGSPSIVVVKVVNVVGQGFQVKCRLTKGTISSWIF